jgi:CheY-like chemotaxis protein
MSVMNIYRVNTLPVSREASAMYIVKASAATHAEVHFTNADGTETRRLIDAADVQAMIDASISGMSNIEVVNTIAERDALAPTKNTFVLVLTATDDPSVSVGSALYMYVVALTTWQKITEYESLDVVLDWNTLANRPTSAVADIDDAVSKKHAHSNLSTLNKFGEDGGGALTFNGTAIGANMAVSEW